MKAFIVDRYGSSGGHLRAGEMPELDLVKRLGADVVIQLFVPVHAGKRRSAPRDHFPHRRGDNPAGAGPVFPFESTNEAMAYVEKDARKARSSSR